MIKNPTYSFGIILLNRYIDKKFETIVYDYSYKILIKLLI